MTRRIALALTLMTGMSGLVYQVTWQRYLATLLGSHGEATAAVLGLFLGGLAIGYGFFGTVTRRRVAAATSERPPRLLALYGAIEAGIGVWALAFPLLFAAVRALSLHLPDLSPGPAFAIDVVLCALLLIPPTFLMGATIPILTQGLSRGVEDATRVHALVYGINTVGAVVGTLLAGFWLIAALGFPNTLRLMALINLGAGLWFWRAGDASELPPQLGEPDTAERAAGLTPYLAAALLSGFSMMTLEVVAIRIGGLSLGSSEYAFAIVVAVFVGCIATGSLLVGSLRRVPSGLLVGSQLALVAVLFWLYPKVPLAPFGAQWLRGIFTTTDAAFYPYQALVFLAAALCIAPAVLLSGATLPLIFDHLRQRYGDLGSAAGRIYSWNTVGSLLGALIGGYTLFLWLDLHHVYRVAVGALVLSTLLLALAQVQRGGGRVPVAIASILVAGLGIGIATQPPWSPEDLSIGLFRTRGPLEMSLDGMRAQKRSMGEIQFYRDDPAVSVAVFAPPLPTGDPAMGLTTNGKSDGVIASGSFESIINTDTDTMVAAAIIPALLADDVRRSFVIGLGTGSTAGEIAMLEDSEEVIVAEISQAVIEANYLFGFATHDAWKHPKVRMMATDAYRALLRDRGRFDLIVSEPSNPWVTGVEMLYSREFLEAVRSRLAPGGVFCQWMHLYETDDATVEMVLRTLQAVFPDIAIWYGAPRDLLILAFAEPPAPEIQLERILERVERPDFADALPRAGVRAIPDLLAHEVLPPGVLEHTALPGSLHTLEHPQLAHLAARAFFGNEIGTLPFSGYGEAARAGREAALLPRYLASLSEDDRLLARRRAVAEVCRMRGDLCTTLLAAWIAEGTDYEGFESALLRSIRESPDAGNAVTRSNVVTAARMIPDGAIPPVGPEMEGRVRPDEAQRFTQIFEDYYHHAAPFDPNRLLQIWDACSDGEERCVEGRREAEALLATGEEPHR